MPTLTVHLVRITNLADEGFRDTADPYVKFELEQDNTFFDKDFGDQVSSKKKDENNPTYNEFFTFDIPTLENMELKIKVMDDDPGMDDKLGECKIKLEKLDLDPLPREVRRKIDDNLFSPDAYIILKLSYGEQAEDDDAEGLSHVGAAAYETLRTKHAEHHHQLWNVTSGKVVGDLHQTPKEAWPGHPVHPDGHDDWFPEIMADIISRTEVWCDVLSLGPPDGKFMDRFKEAVSKVAENAEGKEKPVIIRMMFGNIVGMPVNCNGIRHQLTDHLPPDANINLWVGAWRKGVSWNHAKIIAVDGKYLHTGGHNLWDGHYLSFDPVHDLSLEMEGNVAYDGHLFANKQWDFLESKHETFWGTIGEKMPDSMPQVSKTRVSVSNWPKEGPVASDEHPPAFTRARVAELAEDVEDTIPIITMGRYGALTDKDRPADDAFLAMLGSAQKIVRLALQDLGPVCIPGTKIALPGCVWPDAYLSTLARVLWERGVDVEIVLSNPGSIPGGLSPTEACYGNGWSCVDVAAEIIKRVKKQYPDAEDDDLRAKVSDNLRVCFIREERGNAWEDEMTMGMHAKHFIVDDVACYIGSQNLYVCDLAEWGVVVDDPDQTQKFMEEYWNPMWEHSFTGEDVDVDEVMDGLDIERDGEDPADIDDETKELMKQAEIASAGCGNSELYDAEDE
uniref:Phospholipase D n=1 Tax=Pseudictyota dubia TaxID=2749911 RepID=A0A7R9ZI30_9STRA|mmetsp:Transcript_9712/g.18402  ORF Transcript_9712/g.18402 Transcript_9712/m.18402 type:complete len:676 (+) Transcript_9712:158-2185(+)|eukprot:CAMPEP_0197450312 /NCGR_PEP_ID=MMETSP1175-20131217/24812_1 /TAXON_ID=1003142 /ORGANISM="Triceratium dubium, Strain CCMP147" /LENGTH=675 /DNA_ID=CAMNT_0042982697 /DNA_START=155 /DNA_END=2182 /DNA_ORIENTATION=-